MGRLALILALILPIPALAEGLVAARLLRAGTVLGPGDVKVDTAIEGPVADPREVFGLQLRVTLSANRPLEPEYLAPPMLVARNQTVTIAYQKGALRIETEGRALSAGAQGDVIRVMNSASRVTVAGRVAADGSVIVDQN